MRMLAGNKSVPRLYCAILAVALSSLRRDVSRKPVLAQNYYATFGSVVHCGYLPKWWQYAMIVSFATTTIFCHLLVYMAYIVIFDGVIRQTHVICGRGHLPRLFTPDVVAVGVVVVVIVNDVIDSFLPPPAALGARRLLFGRPR